MPRHCARGGLFRRCGRSRRSRRRHHFSDVVIVTVGGYSTGNAFEIHISALHQAGAQFLGRPYDLTFDWSDERMYCSELVYKVYDRALGINIEDLQRVGDFDLTDAVVQNKMRERYGSEVPLDARS